MKTRQIRQWLSRTLRQWAAKVAYVEVVAEYEVATLNYMHRISNEMRHQAMQRNLSRSKEEALELLYREIEDGLKHLLCQEIIKQKLFAIHRDTRFGEMDIVCQIKIAKPTN